MSWMDRNRHRYPSNWRDIALATKEAAEWRCRVCGAPHGPVPRVLTVHHLNHDPGDCRPANLIACCQSCHLRIQSLSPRPQTAEEAIERLQEWVQARDGQLSLMLREVVS